MNIQLIRSYIKEYKEKFDDIREREIYKWRAVKQFQNNWDINTADIPFMLSNSLALSKNLLGSGNYYPRRVLLRNAEKSPEEIRNLFIYLFNEELDLLERIDLFQTKFLEYCTKNFPQYGKTFQDDRAVMVYLNLRYPDRYYLYKYTLFRDLAKKINYHFIPTQGRKENLGQYHTLCRLLNNEIIKDQELLILHKERLSNDCYFDTNYHLLTQDFIYAVVYYLAVEEGPSIQSSDEFIIPEIIESGDVVTIDVPVSLTPALINHQANSAENKRLGDLGEQWVLSQERERLTAAGKSKLAANIKHISSEKGDGAGYDILSFKEDGTKRYIEVKTTRSEFTQPFYITRNELEKSKMENEKYFLYRVYKFNEERESARLETIRGDLTSLCTCPIIYKVSIIQ